MNSSVIVLNYDHSIINIIDWRRAVLLVFNGKAEIIEESGKTIRNCDRSVVLQIPLIIKLVQFVKDVFKARVAFNKEHLFIRDKFQCGYCPSTEELTTDHVIPVSSGGKTCWENCVTCCKTCNRRKGNKSLQQAGMHLKHRLYRPNYVTFLQAKIELYGLDKIRKMDTKF